MDFDIFQKNLASNLRAARAASGFTQPILAEQARVSVQWVGSMENAKGSPSLDVLHRVADALGTSVSALTWDAEPTRRPDDDLGELIAHLRKMPPGTIPLTRDFVAGLAKMLENSRP